MSGRGSPPAIIVPESPPAAGHKRSRSPERSDSKEEKIDAESSSYSDGQSAPKRRKVVDLREGDGADGGVLLLRTRKEFAFWDPQLFRWMDLPHPLPTPWRCLARVVARSQECPIES
jgi:hypothetical protein